MSECEFCKIELNGMPLICPKCGKHFCSKHKLPYEHACVNRNVPDQEKDPSVIAHDKLEQEHAKYIDEEVTVIKRRLLKKKEPSSFTKFMLLLWSYNLIIIIIVLLITGYFLQVNGVYDIKGKVGDFFEKYGIKMVYYQDENPDELNQLTKVENVDPVNELVQVQKTDAPFVPPEPSIFKIKEIIDNPKRYLDTEVALKGYVFAQNLKVASLNFEYRITNEGGYYIYLLLPQQRGFSEYTYYNVKGVLKQERDTLYVDVSNIERN